MSKQSLSQIQKRIDEILSTLPEGLKGELRGLEYAKSILVAADAKADKLTPLKSNNKPPAAQEGEPSLRKVVDDIIRHQPGLSGNQIKIEATTKLKREIKKSSVSSILSQKTAAKDYINENGRYRISSAA